MIYITFIAKFESIIVKERSGSRFFFGLRNEALVYLFIYLKFHCALSFGDFLFLICFISFHLFSWGWSSFHLFNKNILSYDRLELLNFRLAKWK